MKNKTSLLPHQKKIVPKILPKFLKYKFFGAFLDTGMGKTKITLHLFQYLYNKGLVDKLIVICPKALMDNWEEEIEKHLDVEHLDLNYKRLFEDKEERKIYIVNIEKFQKPDKKFIKEFEEIVKGNFIALDESTKIKNYSAYRTRYILRYSQKAKYKIALTGTPVTQSPLDLFTQFKFLDKGFWGVSLNEFWQFKIRYSILDVAYAGNRRPYIDILGHKHMKELQNKIKPFCLIATKEEYQKDLPEKFYQKVKIELNPQQKRIYKDLRDKLYTEYKGQIIDIKIKLSLFIRFKQITGGFMPETGKPIGTYNPKFDFILAEEGSIDKAVVWSCFTFEIDGLKKYLKKEKIESVSFYGKDKKTDNAVKKFREKKEIKYFIVNPAKGSFGLNLQNSSLSYIISRPASNEQNKQLEDRQHRTGQKNTCIYRDLIASNTVDERLYDLMSSGKNLMEKFKTFSLEDVFSII